LNPKNAAYLWDEALVVGVAEHVSVEESHLGGSCAETDAHCVDLDLRKAHFKGLLVLVEHEVVAQNGQIERLCDALGADSFVDLPQLAGEVVHCDNAV